jgi:hypothetical protein
MKGSKRPVRKIGIPWENGVLKLALNPVSHFINYDTSNWYQRQDLDSFLENRRHRSFIPGTITSSSLNLVIRIA